MKHEDSVAIGERLKKVRLNLSLRQAQMGEKFGINQSTYGQKERGLSALTHEMYFILFHEMRVDLNWLISGEGDLFRNNPKPEARIAYEPEVSYGQGNTATTGMSNAELMIKMMGMIQELKQKYESLENRINKSEDE